MATHEQIPLGRAEVRKRPADSKMTDLSAYIVSVITDADLIDQALNGASGKMRRTAFQHPCWLSAWFRAFPDALQSLHLVTIESPDGEMLLMLPLVLETRDRLTVLTLPDRGVTDYQAPLVSDSFDPDADTMQGLWHIIVKALPPADVLLIEKMPLQVRGPRSPLTWLSGAMPSRMTYHPLALEADFSTLEATVFDGSCMRSLERKRRKLMRHGALEVTIEIGTAAEEAMGELLSWRARRFEAENLPQKAATEHAFYMELLKESQIARLCCLRLDGKMIAGCFGTIVDNSFQMLIVAHDPRWNNQSPGLQILTETIRWCCDLGLDTFDFTIGDESYKFLFGVSTEPMLELRHATSLRGMVYVLMTAAKRMARRALRRDRSAAAPANGKQHRPAEAADAQVEAAQ